eukprot:PITA_29080
MLFGGSIRDNILYGKEKASEAEMIEAAKAANAHDFISSLEKGYETDYGDTGVQLSRGQKQRIAIARAIIKNPSILPLDESTSLLDSQSEKIVQEALDRITVGRTSNVIAHGVRTSNVIAHGVTSESASNRTRIFELIRKSNRTNEFSNFFRQYGRIW